MKFIIKKDQILKALSLTSKALTGKAIIPSLSFLKFIVNKDFIEITGSDGSTAIVNKILLTDSEIANVEVQGEFLVLGRIGDVIRKMNGDNISFELIDETILKLTDGKSSFRLNTINADEYPSLDTSFPDNLVTIKKEDFQEVVSQVAFAASTRDSHPILKAVNIALDTNELVASATDTARLARKKLIIENGFKAKCNIPSKILLDVSKMIDESNFIRIGIEDKRVVFSFGETVVFSPLITGDYPQVGSIINRNYNWRLEINTEEIVNAIERITALFLDKQTAAKLKITKEATRIFAKSPQLGSVDESFNDFEYGGEDLEIAFNCEYVLEAIKAVGEKRVVLEFAGEYKPFCVKSVSENNSLIQVITPLKFFNA